MKRRQEMPEYDGPRRLKEDYSSGLIGDSPWEGSSPYAWEHRQDEIMDRIDRFMNRLAVGTVIFAIFYFGAHIIVKALG
jgi:hypothetical protein